MRHRTLRVAAGAMLSVVLSGCPSTYSINPVHLTETETAQVYTAVLQTNRPPNFARPVVLDTLQQLRTLDAELQRKVMDDLGINRATLDAFLATQRNPRESFTRAIVTGTGWTAALPRAVDSLRTLTRASAAAQHGRPAPDAFWTSWLQAFPLSGGYHTLTPAWVARNGRMALVGLSFSCGQTCGQQEVLRMDRDEAGVWKTSRRALLGLR
jgi:hypothetical protein